MGKEHIIKIESNYGSWVTTHHSILVDGKEYGANNLFVSIDLSHKHIILDTNTFSKITSLLLDKYLFEKKCGNVTYTVTNIFCDEDVVKNLNIPKIYLVSKEDSIEFKKENIFYCIEDHKCEYMLRGDYSNSWKIGYAFLKGYISLFDREGGRVIVYEKKEINILDIQNVFSVSLKLLVYFEIGIITFGLVIIVLSMLDNNVFIYRKRSGLFLNIVSI